VTPAVLPAAIGFTAGLAAGLTVSAAPWTAGACAALAAALLWRRARAPAVLAAALAAGTVWGGGARLARERNCRLRWPDGARVAAVLEPRDLVPASRAHRLTLVRPRRCAGAVAVLLPAAATVTTRIAVAGTWRRDVAADRGPLPTRADRAGHLIAIRVRRLDEPLSARARLRLGAERRLLVLFGSRRAVLAAALTVTPHAGLPRAERERYARAGIVHLLSISGFHVAILAAVLGVLLRAARCGPARARVLGTLVVVLYVWMLGAPAPALRSGAMLAVWAWARQRQRPPVRNAPLAAAALAVLAAQPAAVLDPGPWLSFAGVWGCVAASAWWRRVVREVRERRLRARLRWGEPAVVSAGATLATAPVTLLAFGLASPAGLVANLAAVPLAAAAVPAVALALALALLPGGATLAAIPAAAAGLALDLLDHVAALAARLPHAQVAPADPRLAAFLAAVAALVLLPPPRRRRAARPAFLARGALAAAAVAACAVAASHLRAERVFDYRPGTLTLHFLAVGQGDGAVLRTPRGRWIVIDGGPRSAGQDAGARRVVPFLRRRGVRRIALAVASHGDADHLGGLPAVLRAVPADVVLEPGQPLGHALYREWLAAAARRATRWRLARAGDRLEVDGVVLRVWHPDTSWLGRGLAANENSVVLSVELGRFRALFTGDAGLPMEAVRAATVGDVTLLKVGHHGSRSATGPSWLAAVRPEWCVISVGANRYGHPAPEVLTRLRAAGCATWRTDQAGDVTVATDGRTATVRAAGRTTTLLLNGDEP
jgi:competence protein ComEC